MLKKITEVSLAASLAPTDNPTFYVEKGGVFRRVTLGQLIDCIKDDIDVGGELTEAAKQALLDCFEHVAWVDDQGQTYYDALHDALYPTPTSITAVFTQGGAMIYDTQTLNDLRQYLTVTATYNDGTEKEVSSYTLSGTLTAGTSTITVTYQELTTTFNVTVTHNAARLTAVYTQSGTVYETDSLDSLKTDLVVTYYATQQSQGVVLSDNDYTLSGTLAVGTSTITVTYLNVSATFNVDVTFESYITAVFTQPQTTIYTDDSLDSLKDYLVVTYTEGQGQTSTLTASQYTLSGTLVAGTNTVTVTYGVYTDTFSVTGVVDFYNNMQWSTDDLLTVINRMPGQYTLADGTTYTMQLSDVSGIRLSPVTLRGKQCMLYSSDHSDSIYYPIPCPMGASSVTVSAGGDVTQVVIVFWNYDPTTKIYTRLSETGWQSKPHTANIPQGCKFITINAQGTQLSTNFSVVFNS